MSEAGRASRSADISKFATHLLGSLRCGVLAMDSSGLVIHCNKSAARILDLGSAETCGSHIRVALRKHPALAKLMVESIHMATPPDRAEMVIEVSGRRSRRIGFTLTPVCNGEGIAAGAALFFKDLTPIEQASQQERLRERLAALGTMAACLAHEIRNPLAALEVTTTLLRRKLGPGSGELGLVETLQSQIRRLSGTVAESLEYIRPLQISSAPTSLDDVLEELLEQASAGREGAHVEIVRQFQGPSPLVEADRSRLREALLNLVVNAYEAMESTGGVLRLSREVGREGPGSTGSPGSWIYLQISDTGPGIPEEIQSKVFNPFFSTKTQGSGLGLAWARKVVDAHGGVLDLISREGEGTTFIIRLPASADPLGESVPDQGESLHEIQDSGRRG